MKIAGDEGWRYEGWRVVGAGFTCAMLAVGSTIYVFGLLVIPMSREFDLSRADMNNGLIVLLLGAALWSPLIGRLLDRWSVRVIMAAGGVLLGAGFVIIATSASVQTMLVATALLLALGTSCGGGLAANTVASRWFRRRRGRAMGVMAVATSSGGFLVPPVAAMLIASFGWRNALLIMGPVIGIVMSCAALAFVRDRPRAEQLAAAGELDEDAAAGPVFADERIWTARQFLATREFWLITVSASLLLASDQALIAAQIPYLIGKGVSLEAASILLACQSASAVAGKLLIGFLTERFDVRRLFGVVAIAHVVMLGFYLFWPGYWPMLAVVSLIGIAIGGVYPVWMMLTATTFGSRSFGQVMGAMSLGIAAMSIVALRLSGEAFDRSGSYDVAFLAFLAGVLLAALLIATVRLDRVHPVG